MVTHKSLFIGGKWVTPASDAVIQVVSPKSEEPIGTVPAADERDVDRAVAAARAAFDEPLGWSSWEPAKRADVMERLATALESRSSQTAEMVSAQNGMPISIATQIEGVFPAVLLRYYASLARTMPTEERRAGLFGGTTLVTRKPIGVVGAIVPWNFPQGLAFFKLAPAMAAGATVVIKPSPETVLDSFVLAEAAEEAGVPAGVLNIVPGGRAIGAYLVAHPGINKVSFTGSSATGRSIAETCGRMLRPVTLELGGKSAAIILDDAELSDKAEALLGATLLNSGQTCYVGTRILAPRGRYTEIVDFFTSLVGSLVVGDPLDPATQIGPLVSATQRARVEGYIAKGKSDGARVTVGGARPDAFSKGWFVEPTVFADVDNESSIAQEEIFGPVLSIIPYEGDDEAVSIANNSDFGLGGSVWSTDDARALGVARRVETGSVGINAYMLDPASPFGGVKASGIGRELGPEGLAAYQELKSVYL